MKAFRILIVAGFVLALGLALGPGTVTTASPTQACEYTYYSDATKTTVVGFIGAYCSYTEHWGTVTAWYNQECFTSCGGGGGGGQEVGEWPIEFTICDDGIDNDGDGAIDCYDFGCDCFP